VCHLHGYSISAAVREPLDAPKSAVFDTQYQVSIARMGQRVRVAGGYTIGKDVAYDKHRLELLYKVLDDWFPGAARTHDNPQIWRSTVTCTIDGLPLLGKTTTPGLWLNTAHGLSGWALACGSARLLAEQLSGRPTTLPPEKFSLARFAK
jgi:D-amino-acid dehydrogenase